MKHALIAAIMLFTLSATANAIGPGSPIQFPKNNVSLDPGITLDPNGLQITFANPGFYLVQFQVSVSETEGHTGSGPVAQSTTVAGIELKDGTDGILVGTSILKITAGGTVLDIQNPEIGTTSLILTPNAEDPTDTNPITDPIRAHLVITQLEEANALKFLKLQFHSDIPTFRPKKVGN